MVRARATQRKARAERDIIAMPIPVHSPKAPASSRMKQFIAISAIGVRPHRSRARSLEGRRGLRRQHQREPHDGARLGFRDPDAGRGQLALDCAHRDRPARSSRSPRASRSRCAARRSAPSARTWSLLGRRRLSSTRPESSRDSRDSSRRAASTSASSRRAATRRRTPARRCSRCTWSSTFRPGSTSAALREEFMDFCDQMNLDAILEPVKN